MSALGLSDLRWRARRNPAGGAPLLSLGFLRAGDRRAESVITGLVAYFDGLVGKRRHEYRADVAAEIAGDRRLGLGLSAVLLDWYRWTPLTLAEALPEPAARQLAAAEITTPSALRLRLFDLVNRAYAGFVRREERPRALERLAAELGVPGSAAALDCAMTLDHEGEAVLRRDGDSPTPAAVTARYNRALLAAALRCSRQIVFSLAEPDGALLRRLYARCRRLGVYCDVEGDGGGGFRLRLSGPEAVSAPPAAAGRRLAAAALALVGTAGPLDRAVADLLIYDRPYTLALEPELLRLPGLADDGADPADLGEPDRGVFADGPVEPATGSGSRYDSGVEERFAREFEALRRQGRAAGWRLLREPAPMLAGSRVLIPDFALVRGPLRVFVEVVGFWTPAYLERKRRALEHLPPETRLVLATAEHAVPALAGLPFVVTPYRDAVPVHAVLMAAEAAYGDFAERTAGGGARLAELCTARAGAGWISERDLAAPLGCLTPGEVHRALAAAPPPAGWTYIAGAGLLGEALRGALIERLAAAWAALPELALTLTEVRALLAGLDLPERDQALAAILAHSGACTVVTGALFAIEVRPPGWVPAATPGPAATTMPRRRSAPARPKPPTPTTPAANRLF